MLTKLHEKIAAVKVIKNYRQLYPYVRPYWFPALVSMVITVPIGAIDAVIAWALRPYMDVVMVDKNMSSSALFPILIILFS